MKDTLARIGRSRAADVVLAITALALGLYLHAAGSELAAGVCLATGLWFPLIGDHGGG